MLPAAPAIRTEPAPRSAATRIPWTFAEYFVISQTALPAILMLPGTQPFRLPIRVSAFAISLVAFAWWQLNPKVESREAKAQSWATAIVALLAVMVFHPETPSLMGGLAQVGVYFAVMAPLFWAPAFVRTPEQLARIFWLLLICSGVNSVVGVLQVYEPARFLPAEFSRIVTSGGSALASATYVGPNGRLIVRPPGLFDTPGAVAGPAMAATLLGLVFATSPISFPKRVLSLGFAGAGLAAIYLSQVRISFVMGLLTIIVYAATTFRQGRYGRSVQFAALAGGILVGSFMLALVLGGATIQERFATLIAASPVDVYQHARGVQLEITFHDLLFQHPLGAGLGRWGMAAGYFGSQNPLVQSLWAEIQFTGWMIDGGVPLIALYCAALVVVAVSEWRVATLMTYPRLATCAAVTLALNLGCAALIFSFTPFVTQIGIQYWFLAGALQGVASRYGVDAA